MKTCKLILSHPNDKKFRDAGENIFWDNLPHSYSVYLFYYPSAFTDETFEKNLRDLETTTGDNLFINIVKINDRNYGKIAHIFKIKHLPTIIITAIDELASESEEFLTAYIKIDNKQLLSSPELVIQCIERLYNLFVRGNISEVMKQAERHRLNLIILKIKKITMQALKGIWQFIEGRDISISILEGKFEIKQ
ncbi:MAG: hypothetical protein A2Y62_08780 [Candidatus Fischerbacteria bacterium RBG_13_37_8]|uniref:Thioredoxin-like fold domain-containing protein n=1 Tax=Candidatus Fischerbacteria bacterium RBG_13_37_8 TaxID=1817863 RepID=A0A1F5V9J4_9BACT|nr:MAG: hypothetical protein A2Y62_08780 [Candidatus Fischerbacteria bacterium RBG_13_37_8]